MLTWEKNFKSSRPDGRYTGTLGAFFAYARSIKPQLGYDREKYNTPEKFAAWQAEVREKVKEVLRMPEPTPQPDPKMLKAVPREGYTLEYWEFYPDDFSAVPILMLRPDGIEGPLPTVLCFPGSANPKENLAGEPDLDNPNCHSYRFPERNCQALHCVKQGYLAIAFDNPATCELCEFDDPATENQWEMREHFVAGCLEAGTTYLGVSVFQKLRLLEWLKKQPYVDAKRIAVSGHSLGSEPAIALGILSDDVMAVVFNDWVCNTRERYCAMTNFEKTDNGGTWHYVPGVWNYFSFDDLLAALAPKFVTANEGGSEFALDKIRDSYAAAGASDHLQLGSYPIFEGKPGPKGRVPMYGLNMKELYEDWCRVYAPDHSYRAEPSMRLLKKAFASVSD